MVECKNTHYKEINQYEHFLNGYRNEEFKDKINNALNITHTEWSIAVNRFLKNEPLTDRQYQIVLKIIRSVIRCEYNMVECLIEKKMRVNKMQKFKENCEKATNFIESCWDENNNDGLTFDERISSRLDTLDDDVKKIVLNSMDLVE